jgi:hypothetical protein
MDEGELSMPLSSQSAVDAEHPGDSCCLLQDVVDRSRQKSGMLQGYVRNRMPVSLRGGGGELGNLKP